MLKNIQKHLPVAAGVLAVLVLYSAACTSDMEEEDRAAQYTRDIMAEAKARALAQPEDAPQDELAKWAEQFTPPAPVNQLAQAAQ